jgi:hypothetical protein
VLKNKEKHKTTLSELWKTLRGLQYPNDCSADQEDNLKVVGRFCGLALSLPPLWVEADGRGSSLGR